MSEPVNWKGLVKQQVLVRTGSEVADAKVYKVTKSGWVCLIFKDGADPVRYWYHKDKIELLEILNGWKEPN